MLFRSMASMFNSCGQLTELDLRHFDTKRVLSMLGMFYYCERLKTLNISGWETPSLIDMSSMFYCCRKVEVLDLDLFTTCKVTNMKEVFRAYNSLVDLFVTHWDTSNVIDMNGMFRGCGELVRLDLRSFDVSKVSDFGYMFLDCGKIVNGNAAQGVARTHLIADFYNTTSKTNIDLSRLVFYYLNDGVFIYMADGDDLAVVGMIDPDAKIADIKSTTNIDGYEYNVVAIGEGGLSGCKNVESVVIPSTVVTIGDMAFYNMPSLQSITVDALNENYMSKDYGVLYSKDGKELLRFPPDMQAVTSYYIDNEVLSVANGAF